MSAFRKIKYGFFVFLAVCTVCFMYNEYLNMQMDKLYAEKYGTIYTLNGTPEKDHGNAWIKKSASQKDLFIVGSSELSSPVPQNPKNYFPNNLYRHSVSCVGHAYVQNLADAINFGSNTSSFAGSNVVLVESIQWFTGEDIYSDGFMANFSEMQFYQFLQNPNISEKNKEYLCRRFLEIEADRDNKNISANQSGSMMQGVPKKDIVHKTLYALKSAGLYRTKYSPHDYPQTHILAKLYVSNNPVERTMYYALKPYYMCRNQYLKIRDKKDACEYMKSLESAPAGKTRTIDWSREYSNAEAEGAKACTNNDFIVYDDYYSKYLKDRIDSLKDSESTTELFTSKEWDDYRFMLSVGRELKIKPYIIIMSVNGKYYDYCGMTKAKRDRYYDMSEKIAHKYGMKTLDLKDKEYEPYFYCDVMHLGWKGWLYVEQNIIKNYSGQ